MELTVPQGTYRMLTAEVGLPDVVYRHAQVSPSC